jgi:hypothetical protein
LKRKTGGPPVYQHGLFEHSITPVGIRWTVPLSKWSEPSDVSFPGHNCYLLYLEDYSLKAFLKRIRRLKKLLLKQKLTRHRYQNARAFRFGWELSAHKRCFETIYCHMYYYAPCLLQNNVWGNAFIHKTKGLNKIPRISTWTTGPPSCQWRKLSMTEPVGEAGDPPADRPAAPSGTVVHF